MALKRKISASIAKRTASTAKRELRKAESRRKSLSKTLDTWLARRKSKDPNVRGNAAVAFGMIRGEKARAALIGMLKDRNPDVKKEVVWALGRFQDIRDRPAFGRMLDNPDSRVRRAAVFALERTGTSGRARAGMEIEKVITRKGGIYAELNTELNKQLSRFESADAGVRIKAARELGRIGDKGAVDVLLGALNDLDVGVKRQAVWALWAIRDKSAVKGLVRLVNDPDPGVREAVAWALGGIGNKIAVRGLNVLRGDSDAKVKYRAEQVLREIKVASKASTRGRKRV